MHTNNDAGHDSVMKGTHLFIGVHLLQLLHHTCLDSSMLDEALLPALCRALPPCPARSGEQVNTHTRSREQDKPSLFPVIPDMRPLTADQKLGER